MTDSKWIIWAKSQKHNNSSVLSAPTSTYPEIQQDHAAIHQAEQQFHNNRLLGDCSLNCLFLLFKTKSLIEFISE